MIKVVHKKNRKQKLRTFTSTIWSRVDFNYIALEHQFEGCPLGPCFHVDIIIFLYFIFLNSTQIFVCCLLVRTFHLFGYTQEIFNRMSHWIISICIKFWLNTSWKFTHLEEGRKDKVLLNKNDSILTVRTRNH